MSEEQSRTIPIRKCLCKILQWESNTFGPGFGLREPSVLHQLKGEGNVEHLLVKVLRGEVELVEGDKVAFQQPHQEDEVNAVVELGLQVRHLQVHFVQVLVHEGQQALEENRKLDNVEN